ncbi:MAG TPA: peptide chain release factor-like protein [Acidimicrobiales bacterium]|nr:peptide chain release factor-like protein [Acidimicrobiales bacterium]
MTVDGDVVTEGGLRLPAAAVHWRFSRAGGPGGQHVNTSDTRVELVADLTMLRGPARTVERVRATLGDEVRVVAAAERSQRQNRLAARRRLAARLQGAAAVPRSRRATAPSRGAIEARLRHKRETAHRKAGRRRPDPDD